MNSKIGLQMFTLRNYIGDLKQLSDTLAKVKAVGYDCVQMTTPAFMSTADFKKLLDDNGLFTCAGGGSFVKMITDAKPFIEEAHTLGCTAIFCETIFANMRTSEAGYHAFAKLMNDVGAVLKKEGLTLQYHFHALEFIRFKNGKTGVDILAEDTDPEAIYFMPDTHWMQSGGIEPSYGITLFKGRMDQVHFKDYAVEPSTERIEQVNKLFAEVGEGNINWPKVIAACRDANVEYYIVEQDETRRCPFESIKISYDNMKKFGL